MQFGVQAYRHAVAPIARHRGPRTIHRQAQLGRQVRQLLPPVTQLPRNLAPGILLGPQNLPLPHRVVRVLHRQRLPLRSPALQPRRIRHRKIPGQRSHRPTVTHDVVQHHQQHELTTTTREQPRPHRQVFGEVESFTAGLVQGTLQLVLGEGRGVHDGER